MTEEFERKERYGTLYLLYGKLLTEATQRRMHAFYLEDLSLGEIAQNEKVSRNAVFESLSLGEKDLDSFEERLGLYAQNQRLLALVSELEKSEDPLKKKEILAQMKGELDHGI